MPPHFTANNELLGGDVSELKHPPPDGGLGERCFENLLAQDPDFPLLVEAISGLECTSREYLELCIHIARGLETLGVGKGSHVCFVGRNCIPICGAALATLFLGAVAAPLDPAMRAFEYQHMFALIEPCVLICDSDLFLEIEKALKNLPELNVKLLTVQDNDFGVESVSSLIKRGMDKNATPESFTPTSANADEVCIIAGSSGSTGLPKAVQITNFNMLFVISIVRRPMDILKKADFLHTSHFFWITGLFMYFTCLYVPVRRIIVENVNEMTVLKAMDKYKPFFGLMSPSLLHGLMQHPEFDHYDTSTMVCLIVGGSPLQMATADLVKEVWNPKLILVQAYGLTELTGCYLQPRPDMDIASIGCPNPGTAIKVVDIDTGANLPPGEEGELCCKSLGMMKGYLKNPQATAETIDQDGWLHTGDIGYITEKMSVYITGRIKELMKLDNHQIAPAEIEQLINTVRGVADVAVAGIQISEHSSIPMALVVKQEDAEITEEDIVKCVNENLSDFKQLRAGVVFVDEIPRTTTGKIKRKLLQELANTLYLGDSDIIL